MKLNIKTIEKACLFSVSLNDKDNYVWKGSTSADDKTFTFAIAKAEVCTCIFDLPVINSKG